MITVYLKHGERVAVAGATAVKRHNQSDGSDVTSFEAISCMADDVELACFRFEDVTGWVVSAEPYP